MLRDRPDWHPRRSGEQGEGRGLVWKSSRQKGRAIHIKLGGTRLLKVGIFPKFNMPKVYQKQVRALTYCKILSISVVRFSSNFVHMLSIQMPIVCSANLCLYLIFTEQCGFKICTFTFFFILELVWLSKTNAKAYSENCRKHYSVF